MSDVPWTITSSKRKSNRTTASPRKRTKRIHSATTTNEDSTASRPQRTLTQIAFVTHSSCDDGEPLIDFEPLPMGSPSSPKGEAPRILKRDSTLTQMDFGSSFGSTGNRRSSGMQPPARRPKRKSKKRNSTLTQMDFFNANMDGANELDETMLLSPELTTPKPRKIAGTPQDSDGAVATSARDNELGQFSSPDTQNYQPGKRKRKEEPKASDSNKRRRSSRIAATTPGPVAPSVHVQPDLIRPSPVGRRTPATASKRPPLEIQDSTDFPEESVTYKTSPQIGKMLTPSTPVKDIRRIPSSQTPESIRRNIPGEALSPSKTPSRKALTELSSNLRMPGQKVARHKPRTIDVLGNTGPKKLPPRKICTLKLSRIALVSVEQSYRTERQEHDIYSLQATSSPTRGGSSPQKGNTYIERTAKPVHSSSGPTIKETASSQRRIETQDSLPDISDVLNLPSIAATDGAGDPHSADHITPTKPSGKFDSSRHDVRAGMTLHGLEPENMIPELEEVATDEGSDFGSPVTNDTQFIRNLYQRLSSPVSAKTSSLEVNRAVTVPRTSFRSPARVSGLAQANPTTSPPRRSPLPAPKLVQTSPARRLVRQNTTSSSLRPLPSFSTQNRSFENIQVSLVPLNDTVEYQQSSSSPALPPAPLSSAPGSTRLASIPHPSQVSTQVPSQSFFPTSSAPQTFPFPHDSEVERVTVKDSSSYSDRLSQLMQHKDYALEVEGDLDLLDEAQYEDDLDLDPYTAPAALVRPKKEYTQHTTVGDADVTQTPTQKSRRGKAPAQGHSPTQSSPIITNATTRSQRNAKLEVVNLTSSPSPSRPERRTADDVTPRPPKPIPAETTSPKGKDKANEPPSSSLSSSVYSPSPPRDLKRKYTPIPGFNNDTQSDFTQNGSVTAAYVHRMWDRGDLPRSFVPKPYKVKNFRPGLRGTSGSGSRSGSKKGS